jgi:predicted ester cyclase
MKKLLCIVPFVLLFCFTIACQDKAAMAELKQIKAQGEQEKQNEATLRRLLEENDKGNYALIRELCAPDYRLYFPSNAKPITFEEHMQANKAMYAAFPDFKHTIEDVFAKGDKAVFRVTLRGTHTGSFMGIPPTGKSFEYSAIGIARFRDGKIVEMWLNGDFLGLMQQLGMELKPIATKKK